MESLTILPRVHRAKVEGLFSTIRHCLRPLWNREDGGEVEHRQIRVRGRREHGCRQQPADNGWPDRYPYLERPQQRLLDLQRRWITPIERARSNDERQFWQSDRIDQYPGSGNAERLRRTRVDDRVASGAAARAVSASRADRRLLFQVQRQSAGQG